MDIRNKVAIIGTGCSRFGERYEASREDLICEAAFEAYADAGVEPQQIEAAWLGVQFSGQSATPLGDALKLFDIPMTRVENYCASGMDAVRNAAIAVAAGMYDVVLALGYEKMRDGGFGRPYKSHPLVDFGEAAPHIFALAAQRYFRTWGASKEDLARVAVKNHHNGTLSPKAHMRMEVTPEQVLKAPMIYAPLGLFDCCPTTDGAAAVILCRADLAKSFVESPVWVKGIGLSVQSAEIHHKPGYDYLSFPATVKASRQAYDQAGVTADEIDFAEVHDCFSITEILNYEDLGFSRRGEGFRDLKDGKFALGGEKPVNPSGGLKSFGHPIGATGARMIYECTQQLQGRAGERQVKNARLGLAHNLGGPAAVSCVTVLGNEL
ncbi:MAG TPA: acetyl-CoA acetyltransferase [Candidatus Binatia bacterium]|nr:acetyl-CoA acetyltransferase [Candidatus Binatia bacterium]